MESLTFDSDAPVLVEDSKLLNSPSILGALDLLYRALPGPMPCRCSTEYINTICVLFNICTSVLRYKILMTGAGAPPVDFQGSYARAGITSPIYRTRSSISPDSVDDETKQHSTRRLAPSLF